MNSRLASYVCLILVVALGAAPARADDFHAVIRTATSADGLDFTPDRNDLFRGSAPNLIVLANGDWLLIFRAFDEDFPTATAELLMSTSRDEGRTWSAPRRSQLIGKRGIRHPGRFSLLALPDGSMRMIYARATTRPVDNADAGQRDTARNHTVWSLRFADSRKGLFFRDVGRVTSLGPFPAEPTAAMLLHENQFHVFAEIPTGNQKKTRSLRHVVVTNERDPVRLADSAIQDGFPLESIVAVEKGFRGFATTAEGIASWTSADGRDWSRDQEIRLEDATSPSVIRKRDGSYLMLYVEDRPPPPQTAVRPRVQPESTLPPIPEAPATDAADELVIVTGLSDENLADEASEHADPADDDSDTLEQSDSTPDLTFFDPDDFNEPLGASSLPGFAPLPNFENPVDYIAWYRSASTAHAAAGENAYDAYAKIFPDWRKETANDSDQPQFHDMLNDGRGNIIPEPWDPDRHPQWVKSHTRVADMLKQFQEASRIARYVQPMEFRDAQPGEHSEGSLSDLALPFLFRHRELARAILADAWRLRNGKVDAQRMMEAWRTVLRNATHLQSGMTLIEELVGFSQQQVTRRSAIAALDHQLFSSPQQMRSASAVLSELDHTARDPMTSLRGEHAIMMSLMQRLASSVSGGQPASDNEPITKARLIEMWNEEARDPSADEARAIIHSFDQFYRQIAELMSIGYPVVRKADITALSDEFLELTPFTEALLPSLNRVYTLRTRGEATRRATQLVYALHIFHTENDRWPNSLAELPAEPGLDIRIDPFTGLFFGYRVDDDDFRLYSLSENARDDHGIHAPRWDDQPDPATGSDDFVFWPMQP